MNEETNYGLSKQTIAHLEDLYKKQNNNVQGTLEAYAGELGIYNIFYGEKVDPSKKRKFDAANKYLSDKRKNESKRPISRKLESKLRLRVRDLIESILKENPDRNLLNKQINTASQKLIALCEEETDTLEPVAQVQVYIRVAEFLQKRALSIKQSS